jgi:hypothetical protein
MTFTCIKCDYKTNVFRNIKNHTNVKKSCTKKFDCLDMSDDQILICSLISNFNNKTYDIEKIKMYKYTYKNKNILINELEEIDKNKTKICKYCNNNFIKIQDLKNHVLYECFENEMGKKNKINNIETEKININNGINKIEINETTNISGNTINNNNITNIIFNINTSPIPFDNNWDLSKIDIDKKAHIMLSQYMYTFLLNEILKNDDNLNIIIDKEKNFGVIYKNEIDKYIEMGLKDIANFSMEKLHENLLSISDELKTKSYIDKHILDYKNKDIKNKLQCYINNKDTNKTVNGYLIDIFDNKKEKSHKIMKEYLKNNSYNSDTNKEKGF